MAEVSISALPFSSLEGDALVSILNGMTDYIGVHQVVFDEFGRIVDAKLRWCNDSYRNVRMKPVELNQSMAETYFEPHIAFAHVNEAWEMGRSFQIFEMPASTRDRYRESGKAVTILVNWQRVGDFIVEAGSDNSEFVAMQELLKDQRSLVAIASKKRALAVERQRIAHNLHDSVIQQLYATSLGLSIAAREADDATAGKIGDAMESIGKVIEGIRREILDVQAHENSPLQNQLEDVLIPIVAPVGAEFELTELLPNIDQEFVPHVRAICQEATSNAIRHGQASRVLITLEREGGNLHINVSDNGLGINPDAPSGSGLNNMRQRAQSMGGTMKVSTRSGGGTAIDWSVPHPGWES